MYKTEIPKHLLKCLGIKGSVMHYICKVFNIFSYFMVLLLIEH